MSRARCWTSCVVDVFCLCCRFVFLFADMISVIGCTCWDVAVFFGVYFVAFYEAFDVGLFGDGGFDVHFCYVCFSCEQFVAWDAGWLDAIHMLADHFVCGVRPVGVCLVCVELLGELVVHVRFDVCICLLYELRWVVDVVDVGFVFVLWVIVVA